MNKIIVSDCRYGNSSYKVYNFAQGDYNVGDLVEVQEGGSSRFAVITERKNYLSDYGNGCATCVFRNPDLCHTIPCGYATSDGWFPCVALANRVTSISFKPIDLIMEEL